MRKKEFAGFDVDANSSFSVNLFVLKGIDEMELNSYLSALKLLYLLKLQYSNRYDKLVNVFKDLFPIINKINVEVIPTKSHNFNIKSDAPVYIDHNFYSINVVDNTLSIPISFELLSDGVKRIFFN